MQIIAEKKGETQIVKDLEEIREVTGLILSAEVKEKIMIEKELIGMDHKRLREVSHNVRKEFGIDHPIPHYSMGELAIKLNSLRTKVRNVELSAIEAVPERLDIIQAFNRMSSCVYIIFCKLVSEKRN